MSSDPIHVVLVGDSIFDNDTYVLGEPGVIEQMRRSIPNGWSAFKIAVDGDCIGDVASQLEKLPTHATDIVLSVGGNDMIGYSHLLSEIQDPRGLPTLLATPRADFAEKYAELLETLMLLPTRLTVCTVYTAIPFQEPEFREYARAAITAFNEAILEEADKRGIPVVRLERICTEDEDFSAVSPIEPSAVGGQKIVDALIQQLQHQR
jgi:hypothetical protein